MSHTHNDISATDLVIAEAMCGGDPDLCAYCGRTMATPQDWQSCCSVECEQADLEAQG